MGYRDPNTWIRATSSQGTVTYTFSSGNTATSTSPPRAKTEVERLRDRVSEIARYGREVLAA